ncbi:MAG TPA: sugar ABC transporter permease [Acidimicrobiales bacterium]|nr:sugar ABC transporter permease [Acidimicrobiales bacterium]
MTAAELEPATMTPVRRRRRAAGPGGLLRRIHREVDWMPYWLLLPSIVLVVALLGYPVVRLVETSFQEYGLFQLFNHTTTWNGVSNYKSILTTESFWASVLRTLLFTAACVGLTMVVGAAVALMLARLGKILRTTVSITLVLAWAMPPVSAAVVWQWLFADQFGVVDWILAELHLGNLSNLDWTGTSPLRAFSVIAMMIVWQAIPFVALSLYAGLVQIPDEMYESARTDGAGSWAVFRWITMPLLGPIFGLLTILSIIWDFNVFTQIYVLTQGGPNGGTETIGIWSYVQAFAANQFGLGAAASVVSMLLVGVLSFYYVRNLIRSGEIT